MITQAEAKKYYEAGKQATKKYNSLRDAMLEENVPWFWPAQKAFDMGFSGIAWEVKDYQRLGDPPDDGPSYNYMEQCQEHGVSVITEEWQKTIHGIFFMAKNNHRSVITFKGIFTGHYGGDDEPLVLPVK